MGRRLALTALASAAALVLGGCSGGDGGPEGGGSGEGEGPTTTATAATVDTSPVDPAAFPDVAAVTGCPRGYVLERTRGYSVDPTVACAPNPLDWRDASLEGGGVVLAAPLRFRTLDTQVDLEPAIFEYGAVRIDQDCTGSAVRNGPESDDLVVHLRATESDGVVRLQFFDRDPDDPDRQRMDRLEMDVQQPGFFDSRCAR